MTFNARLIYLITTYRQTESIYAYMCVVILSLPSFHYENPERRELQRI